MKMMQMPRGHYLVPGCKTGTRQKGFVLILVVTIMVLIGAEMFVLTGLANTMLFESNTAHLQAIKRNLTASGLAWAKRNIKNQRSETFNRTIDLDVTNMYNQRVSLSVTIGVPRDKKTEVQINTLCSRRRRTLSRSAKYHIEL